MTPFDVTGSYDTVTPTREYILISGNIEEAKSIEKPQMDDFS